jgi:hypothetical protein
MDRLLLSMPPAMPNKRCGFLSREPSVARDSPWRKRHAHQAAVKAFFRMVIDGGAKCL